LLQPSPLFGYGLMHPLSQFLRDLFDLRLHAVAAGPPSKARDLPQIRVIPRKLKVSGFPSPRCFRPVAAWRPNSIRRVFSGCSDSENSCSRIRISSQKRRASASCSKRTTISSA
jgi:hypothetical protein